MNWAGAYDVRGGRGFAVSYPSWEVATVVDVDAPRGESLNVGRTEIDEEGEDEKM
jgi:hypothetical protein